MKSNWLPLFAAAGSIYLAGPVLAQPTVDSARRSFVWTTTANRRPRWTCPRRRGSVIAWTSPRTTKLLHQRRDLARLSHVAGIAREPVCLRRKPAAPPVTLASMMFCSASILSSTDLSSVNAIA